MCQDLGRMRMLKFGLWRLRAQAYCEAGERHHAYLQWALTNF
jgi:hypothetical protein